MQQLRYESQIHDVIAEEFTYVDASLNLRQVGGGISGRIAKFSLPGRILFRREDKSQKAHFRVTKEAFGEVYLGVVAVQPL